MLTGLTVLLTICACAVKECECGGTLVEPIADEALCDRLIPPGMEHIEPVRSFNLFTTVTSWSDGMLFVVVNGCGEAYSYSGFILQGRVDGKARGNFHANSPSDRVLHCEPYSQNTLYSINFTHNTNMAISVWLPPYDYDGKNMTMHTTIIKNNKTYFQYVDQIPMDPRLAANMSTTTTTTTTEMSTTTTTTVTEMSTTINTPTPTEMSTTTTEVVSAKTPNTTTEVVSAVKAAMPEDQLFQDWKLINQKV